MNGQPVLDGKILDEIYPMLPTDLRRDVDQKNKQLHRAGKPMLNGQQTLRMWFDSMKGTSHPKLLHFMQKFMSLSLKNNDLRGYNRALDDITDELEGTQLEVLSTNKDILRLQYLKQVRYHPRLKYHMATWSTLPEDEQTYDWLRDRVQRVIDEHHILENDKVWEKQQEQSCRANDQKVDAGNMPKLEEIWTMYKERLSVSTRWRRCSAARPTRHQTKRQWERI